MTHATILVTGGAGFIGGCLVRRLLADSAAVARVVNLDKLTYAGNLDSLAPVADDPRHVFVRGDIGDRALVARLLEEHRPSAVVNCAAETHVDRSIEGPRAFLDTNVVGTFELLTAALAYWRGLEGPAREAFRFLHVSTDEVYGSLGAEGRFTEQTPYDPHSPYSASKAASDHFVRAFGDTYGLPVLVTNCSNNYGPYQFPEKLIPLVTLNALEGKPLPVYGDGGNVRDWLYVEDHARALWRVLEAGRPGETYNLGGDSERTNLEVVRAICDAVDDLRPGPRPRRELIAFVPDRPGHDRRYAIDASKALRELGWRPEEAFASGLRRTVRWYLDNPDWVARVSSGSYRRERLGLDVAAAANTAPAQAPDDLAASLAYNRWADEAFLDVLRALPAGDYARAPAPGWSSIRATLVHVAGALDIWARRLEGQTPSARPGEDEFPTLGAAARFLRAGHDAMGRVLAGLSADRLASDWEYRDLSGAAHRLPLWSVFRHVVNHGSYHRGQVASKLRLLGVEPPATDLVVWARLGRGGG